VDRVEGKAGDFLVTLTKKPRYIIEEKCTGCTTCVEYCPVEYPDPFNQGISQNKATHVYFSQAIPLVAYIDESCIYLKEKKCLICEGVCQPTPSICIRSRKRWKSKWAPSFSVPASNPLTLR
jgi:heterodisulfide reductase subunit A